MLVKFSQQEPKNCIAIPNDICQIEGGGLSTSGGKFDMKFLADIKIPSCENIKPREMKAYREELDDWFQI